MAYARKLKTVIAGSALLSLTACGSIGRNESPPANPVKEVIKDVQQTACKPAGDLLRQTEPEPVPPTPRDPDKGLQPDELYGHSERLSEWGSRGWNRVLDWVDREFTLGSCAHGIVDTTNRVNSDSNGD